MNGSTQKKHIVIYTENYVYGGLEKFLFDLVNNINYDKYEISLLYNHNPDFDKRFDYYVNYPINKKSLSIYTIVPYFQWIEKKNYPKVIKTLLKIFFFSLKYPFFISNIFLLRKEFSKFQIDILHIVNGGYPAAESCLAAVLAGKLQQVPRIILSILSYPFPRRLKLLEKFIDLLVCKHLDIVITLFQAASNAMVNQRNFPPEKLRVIYTGIEKGQNIQHEVMTITRKKFNVPPLAKVVGVVGAFEHCKGHRYLLEAIPLIKKKSPDVKYILVGDGCTRKELEKFVQSQGLSKDVIFTGYIRGNIFDVIDLFDIFVLPSYYEGLPYAILEAMSLGKPIVATEVGGIPEQLNTGVSGILVPPKDPEELANAIIYLLNNEEKAKELGAEAQKRFRECFTLEMMISSIENLYDY